MRRPAGLVLVLVAASLAFGAAGVSVDSLRAMERNFNKRIERFSIDDPIFLLSSTQGAYLQGWGALFTAEVNLVPVAISPFRPSLSPEEIERLHAKKKSRLDVIESHMREMLTDAGASLDTVPAGEKVGLAVNLFYFQWEKKEGLPNQILMHATRSDLVALKAGNGKPAGEVIRVERY